MDTQVRGSAPPFVAPPSARPGNGLGVAALVLGVDSLVAAVSFVMFPSAVLSDPRAGRRRRLAEPDLEFRAFCPRRRLPASSTRQLERTWDAWQAERYMRSEISQRPGYTDNPFRPR